MAVVLVEYTTISKTNRVRWGFRDIGFLNTTIVATGITYEKFDEWEGGENTT